MFKSIKKKLGKTRKKDLDDIREKYYDIIRKNCKVEIIAILHKHLDPHSYAYKVYRKLEDLSNKELPVKIIRVRRKDLPEIEEKLSITINFLPHVIVKERNSNYIVEAKYIPYKKLYNYVLRTLEKHTNF